MDKEKNNNFKKNVFLTVSLLLIVSAVFFTYSNTFLPVQTGADRCRQVQTGNFDFINWDDNQYVYENPHIQSLTLKSLLWMLTESHASNWHPITWLSHALDYHFFGLDPGMHHLVNVILHCLNTLLIFFLIIIVCNTAYKNNSLPNNPANKGYPVKDTGILLTAVIASFLFGLHPMHVESVAWVSERKDLLCAFFLVPTYMFYLFYASAKNKNMRLIFYATGLFFFILSLMSKPMAITVPMVLLLLDIFPLKRIVWGNFKIRETILEKIPFFLLSIGSGLITITAQEKGGAIRALSEFDFYDRLLNSFNSIWFYIEKLIIPRQLTPFYPFPENISLFSPQILLSLSFFIIISVFCIWKFYNGRPLWITAWLYYLITLMPVIGLIQVGIQGAADRYTYLPSLSLFFLAGFGVTQLWGKSGIIGHKGVLRIVMAGALIFMAGLYIHLSRTQNMVWQDSITLWKYVIKNYPGKVFLAHNNLSHAYQNKGMLDEAITECKKAIEIKPDYVEAYNNLAAVYNKKGMYEEARSAAEKALSLYPDYAMARLNLGVSYDKLDMPEKAFKEYQKVILIKPDMVQAYFNLGNYYLEQKMEKEAIDAYQSAIKINPAYLNAYNNLGNIYFEKGDLKKAELLYQKAVKLSHGSTEALANLALVSQRLDRYAASIDLYKKAIANNPENAFLHFNLAKAYMETKRVKDAALEYEKALLINPDIPEALIDLSFIYISMKKFQKAIELLNKKIEIAPDVYDAYYNLACIFSLQNKKDEAVLWLKKAVDKGFTDFKILEKDNDLINIRDTSYYNELVNIAD